MKHNWLAAIALALALALAAHGAAAFDLQGHRGARGLAPENTLAGFQRALAVGVSTLEIDIYLTADGHLVVHHDPQFNPDLARAADGSWVGRGQAPLKTLTLAEVQAVDVGRLRPGSATARQFPEQVPADGQRIPTFDEFAALLTQEAARHVRLNVEIKLDPRKPALYADAATLVRAVHAALKRHGLAQRAMIQSFNWEPLKLSQQESPGIPTGYLSIQQPNSNTLHGTHWTAGMSLDAHGTAPRMVKAAGGAIWTPNHKDLTPELVQEAKALGLKVIPWTVNETADMERVVGMDVDGLITDYPDRAREVLHRHGIALPAPVAVDAGRPGG